MSLRWDGIDNVMARIEGIAAHVDAAVPDALEKGMEVVEAISVPLVPVENSALVGSRHLYATTKDGNPAHAFEYRTPYARYQHYRVDLHHETGQALYQEQAVREGAQPATEVVAHEIGKAL